MNNILKQLRSAAGKTQAEVAQAVNMSRSTYTNIEIGARNPSVETMKLLADYFNVSIDVAFGSGIAAAEDEGVKKVVCIYNALNATGQQLMIDYAEMLVTKPSAEPYQDGVGTGD